MLILPIPIIIPEQNQKDEKYLYDFPISRVGLWLILGMLFGGIFVALLGVFAVWYFGL